MNGNQINSTYNVGLIITRTAAVVVVVKVEYFKARAFLGNMQRTLSLEFSIYYE